ncbi:MAG: glycoside hydrolase family 32 protein [Atopobium sp.]|nr:glycoside hydrolase family 32 protein [Atopobium sp.]
MWECPDLIRIQDQAGSLHEFLAFCPQRSAEELGQKQGRSFAGYIPLSSRVLDIASVDTGKFTFWDYGFDFYAPQSFVDERGRTILFAWMGQPDTPYITKPTGLGFWQCLTVPRLITLNMSGLLCAYPVPELARLHTRSVQVSDRTLVFPENRADILIRGIYDDFCLIVDDALEVFLWAAMWASASFNQRLPADVQKDDALSLMPKRSES